MASWYSRGARTADGRRFNPNGLSIAMPSRHFGDRYRIQYRGRSVVVVHNDFGPAARLGRCVDLSYGAARALGTVAAGVIDVTVNPIAR